MKVSAPVARRIVPWAAALCVAAVGACGQGGGDRPVRAPAIDTSGAAVKSISGWPDLREMADPTPLYSDGEVEVGAPVFRVMDLLPREDGGVFIANGGSHEILAVDRRGELLWRAGREGEGPGEFGALVGLQAWKGDTVIALDGPRNAASFWTSSGEFGRILTAGPVSAGQSEKLLLSLGGSPVGVLDDGRLVVRGPQRAFGAGEPGLRRVRTALTVVDPENRTRLVPVELPGPWVYEVGREAPMPALLAPMSGGTDVTVPPGGADIIVWARADAFEVVELTPDGRAVRVRRVEKPRKRITASLRRAYLEQWSPWFEVDGEIPFPSHVPAFDRVFVSTGGDVWARRYHWGDAGEEWIRFATTPESGATSVAARLGFPPRVEVMGATETAAYAVRRNELDVEHVVRFDLGSP